MKTYYEKKRREVEAVQWNKHGDHPAVEPFPKYLNVLRCDTCRHKLSAHGVFQLGGGHPRVVCPGDFIRVIGKINPEHWPKAIFEANFEVSDLDTSHLDAHRAGV